MEILKNLRKKQEKNNKLAQKRQILTNDTPFLKMADSSEAVFSPVLAYET